MSFSKGQNPGGNLPDISPKCSATNRDVVFFLDASESISKTDFQLAKQFITQMIKVLKSINSQNRIALVVFGDSADIVFNFSKYDSFDGMIRDVDAIKNQNGLTAIGKAFNITSIELLPTMRTGEQKLILLLTDGTNNKYPAPFQIANTLKFEYVKILTIGIGSGINSNELETLSTPGLSMEFDNFTALSNIQNQVFKRICSIPELINTYPCRRPEFDVVILLDYSQSISDEDYAKSRQFLTSMFNNYDAYKVFVTIMSLSNRNKTTLLFQDFYKNLNFIDNIKNSDRLSDLTDIGEGLKWVDAYYKSYRIFTLPLNVIIVTNGVNKIYPNTFKIADSIKALGINIITLGIGSNMNLIGLKALSSDNKILTTDSFYELHKSLKVDYQPVLCDKRGLIPKHLRKYVG